MRSFKRVAPEGSSHPHRDAPDNVSAMAHPASRPENRGTQPGCGRGSSPRRWPRTSRSWRQSARQRQPPAGSPTCCFSSATGRARSRSTARSPCTTSARGTCCRRSSPARSSSRWARTSTTDRRAMARSFAHGAPTLAKFAARQAPVDLDAPIEPPPAVGGRRPRRSSCRAPAPAPSTSRCSCSIPSSSCRCRSSPSCRPSCFRRPCGWLRLVRRGDGDFVIREGEPGVGVLLRRGGRGARVGRRAAGDGRPTRASSDPPARGGAVRRDVAADRAAAHRLDPGRRRGRHPGGQSRGRRRAHRGGPGAGRALDQFARERLLKNLLATSPLFRPFNHQQQMDLVRRFEGHEIAAGTTIIREGEAGQGLFVVLAGEVEVAAARRAPVARLRAGEVFGEMSLLGDSPTTADGRAPAPRPASCSSGATTSGAWSRRCRRSASTSRTSRAAAARPVRRLERHAVGHGSPLTDAFGSALPSLRLGRLPRVTGGIDSTDVMTILRRAPRWLAVLLVALCDVRLGRGVRRAALGRQLRRAAGVPLRRWLLMPPPATRVAATASPYSGGYGYGGGPHSSSCRGSAATATAAASASSARWPRCWWSGWWSPRWCAPCAPAASRGGRSAQDGYGGYEDGEVVAMPGRAYLYRLQLALGRSARGIQDRLAEFAARGDTETRGRAGGAAAADGARAPAREGRRPLPRHRRRAAR